ncbi:MAG: Nif3-like dinuclear metal center hexameric protein [Phycisphaerae bacterium]|nr:Nif3-like dinuclear metal center hexameric protein [Phycisphaerae bacterium]
MARRTTNTVGNVCQAMEILAPSRLAQAWDNVGLLVGDRAAPCTRVLLCIDTTPAVLAEAVRRRCPMIVSYHPPIFRPIKAVLADSESTDAIVHEAIRHGISIYSPHTALDAVDGGTNDVLASLCGLRDVGPFEFVPAGRSECKIVTFVPPAALDRVAEAMFAAGAGRIGAYEKCSYRLRGEGTFFGTDETHPAVGRKGRLEHVDEVRIETVAPRGRLSEIVAALTAAHPYETPAYDVYPLDVPPAPGIGRVGRLPTGTTLGGLARLLKRRIGSSVVQIVGRSSQRLRRAAVCAGAAGLLPLEKTLAADADVVVTGEIHHHDALTYLRTGRCAIALGHSESERPVLASLAKRLAAAVPGVKVHVSRADTGPLRPV